MSALILTGQTANELMKRIKRDKIIAGKNVQIVSESEDGTFLRVVGGGREVTFYNEPEPETSTSKTTASLINVIFNMAWSRL